jgi:hypothetical protein
LENIALFLGSSPGDLLRFGAVCHSFYTSAQDCSVWKHLAMIKYGSTLATKSVALYDNHNWKTLMIDNNKRGALPTISIQKACNYKHYRPNQYYCCFVECVMWDRDAHEIRVYIDVRGEIDLQHPLKSSMKTIQSSFQPLRIPNRFVCNTLCSRKHHKGYLVFPFPSSEICPGDYTFCYANRESPHSTRSFLENYETTVLFSIPLHGGGLSRAFGSAENQQVVRYQQYSFREDSPFDNDTPQTCRARFTAVVPQWAWVMNEQIPEAWFVDP